MSEFEMIMKNFRDTPDELIQHIQSMVLCDIAVDIKADKVP